MRHNVPDRQAGYTLLEVIVAMALLSILAVALSGSLSFGSRVWEHTARALRSSGDTVMAYQFLESSFAHLAKLPRNAQTGDDQPDFLGDSTTVAFRTDDLARVGLAGPRLVALQVKAGRLEASLPPDAGTAAPADRTFVLLSAVTSMTLAYRGYTADQRDSGWIDEWPEQGPPPNLIRITLTNAADEARVWFFRLPELGQ